MSDEKQPPLRPEAGRVTYEAYILETVVYGYRPPWEKLTDRERKMWTKVEFAARYPVAVEVYNARRALARLLITYRSYLQGDWYERSTEDSGMALDEIGFIKGPYGHDSVNSFQGSVEVEKITREPKSTFEN